MLDYLGLSPTIWDYLGLSLTMLDYLQLSPTISDELGLYGIIWDYQGLSWTIWDYMVLSGTIWDYLKLSWTRVQVKAKESKFIAICKFFLNLFFLTRPIPRGARTPKKYYDFDCMNANQVERQLLMPKLCDHFRQELVQRHIRLDFSVFFDNLPCSSNKRKNIWQLI